MFKSRKLFTLMTSAMVLMMSSIATAVEVGYKSPTVKASYYGPGFHGKRTASGEKFNQNAHTAAHKTLPFGTKVRVTNKKTGKSVVVKINDRGPYAHGRSLDLSKAAFVKIGDIKDGVHQVTYEVLKIGDGKYRRQ